MESISLHLLVFHSSLASAILMLIACLFHAGGMGLWHGVEHWENEKIKASSDSQSELFKMNWSEVRVGLSNNN